MTKKEKGWHVYYARQKSGRWIWKLYYNGFLNAKAYGGYTSKSNARKAFTRLASGNLVREEHW